MRRDRNRRGGPQGPRSEPNPPRARASGRAPQSADVAVLNVLRKAGLVADTREGRVIRVRAEFARMYGLIDFLTENCCGGGATCLPEACAPASRTAG